MNEQQQGHWKFVAVGVWITLVSIAFARLSYGTVLPHMKEGLLLSYKQSGFLGTLTSFGYLGTVIFAGLLARKWGCKKTVQLGLLLITAGFSCLAFVTTYRFGLLGMFLLGVGTGFTFTPLVTLLTEWFPSRKGLVIGFINGGAGIGMLLVGILVPFLQNLYPESGWRIAWASFGGTTLVVWILTRMILRDAPQKSATMGTAFSTHPRDIYRNPGLILIGSIYAIIGVTYIIHSIFIMSFMLEEKVSLTTAGYIIAANGVLSIFSAPVWGGISDRWGRRFALVLAMGFNVLATLIPVIVPSVIGFVFHNLVIGATATGLFTLIQAMSTEQVPPKDIPVAFSYVTLFFAVGQLIGPSVAGWIIDFGGGLRMAFLFSLVFLIVGFFLAMKVKQAPFTAMETATDMSLAE